MVSLHTNHGTNNINGKLCLKRLFLCRLDLYLQIFWMIDAFDVSVVK